jgi:FkbM family methyltransferase
MKFRWLAPWRLASVYARVRHLGPSRRARAAIWGSLARGLSEQLAPFRSRSIRSFEIQEAGERRRLHLRANYDDAYTFYEVFVKGVYERLLPIVPGGVVVDIGANIGLTSAYFLTAGSRLRVVAVEPEEENLDLLRRNLDGSNVEIHAMAIAPVSGDVTLELATSSTHRISYDAEPTPGRRRVPALSLDDLAEHAGIDRVAVLKVDIEGAEEALFARPWELLSKTDKLVIEIHESAARPGIVASLETQGFGHLPPVRRGFPDVFVATGRGPA